MNFQKKMDSLTEKIKQIYESGITMEDAEKLAAEFLHGQILGSEELSNVDLDARMKKSGLKAIRAKAYLDIISNSDKKPTEAQIAAIIESDELVASQQKLFDESEVRKSELERFYDICLNGHIYTRGIAKGSFGG